MGLPPYKVFRHICVNCYKFGVPIRKFFFKKTSYSKKLIAMRKTLFIYRLVFVLALFPVASNLSGQATFPENGVVDPRHGTYAFTNATIVKDVATTLNNATMVIKDGKIISVGSSVKVPAGAVEVDCKGKFIYPSFIDIYADYGTTLPTPQQGQGGGGGGFFGVQQFTSNAKGAYGWNQAIKAEADAFRVFTIDDNKAKPLREAGFGTVLSHVRDGISRGSGTVVTLANSKENLVMLKEKASAHYSFSKGTSTQSYPGSMMGTIALLRQSFLDAQWYKQKPTEEGVNISMEAWNNNLGLPQIFDANDKWNCLRADKIGDEFGVQYILKGGGNEYQRIKEMKASNASFIVSLNFPQAQDVEDPNEARFVSLNDMKHWEMAPANAAYFEKAGINFCITTADLRNITQFWTNLRKAMDYGLSERKAMEALTKAPATLLGIYDQVGSLDEGKIANFIITNGPVFNQSSVIIQNWIQGEKYSVKEEAWTNIAGTYKLTVNTPAGAENYTVDIKSNSSASVYGKDTLSARFSYDGKTVKLSYAKMQGRRGGGFGGGQGGNFGGGGFGGGQQAQLPATATRLSGYSAGTEWNGTGTDSLGNSLTWTAVLEKAADPKPDTTKKKDPIAVGKVLYPFEPFGFEEGSQPKQETILIKNATIWTNEKEGVLQNSDILLKDGKISAIGKNLPETGAKVIDGTGKYVSAGIIDEHSHIAASSINEGAQSVTSEVRITDNLNPDDINIYRQLSGGVTSSHILHGSANVIGGQTQLIKLRWGANDDDLKFKGWPGQIKFALGENVKRSPYAIGNNSNNNRFPDTRMGVEQVLVDAFTRAKDYKKAWADYNGTKDKKGLTVPRRDLELEALV